MPIVEDLPAPLGPSKAKKSPLVIFNQCPLKPQHRCITRPLISKAYSVIGRLQFPYQLIKCLKINLLKFQAT